MPAKNTTKFDGCTLFIPRIDAIELISALENAKIAFKDSKTFGYEERERELAALKKLKNSIENYFILEAQHASNIGISSH